ncbi:receptor-interacting serine/threonine-protein kinase 4-like [Haliotis asinina]|uniref:receptor-interacting serine/threonine-protein kinase 4-like n=1 Tax=Haliotis asinina TaxID=109174 RepID=UPI003532432F
MADDYGVLRDLKSHLKSANIPLENLSTLAQQGDDKLVKQFLTENIKIEGSGPEATQSQLYIACFWGIKDIVKNLLDKGIDANYQNKDTLWTPLHAATFQEHGPVVMLLLENNSQPELPDAEGRTPKDFASASDKIWPHFAAMGLERTPKSELIDKGIIKKIDNANSLQQRKMNTGGIRMAAYSRPESAYAYNSEPFLQAAATGDVLADVKDSPSRVAAPYATGGSYGSLSGNNIWS